MRYALYYVPEQQSPLAMLGASLLGWDVYKAQAAPMKEALCAFENAGLTLSEAQLETMTKEARRYGMHATLKAPFHLADGYSEAQLIQAVESFAATQKVFALPPLQVQCIADFFALTLQEDTAQERHDKEMTQNFATQCVQYFDGFRRPPSAVELARRRQKKLSARQEDNLLRYGYPYVLEDFRFHITLCHVPLNSLYSSEEGSALLQNALTRMFSAFLQHNKVHYVHLCRSDASGYFSLLHKAPLAG